MKVAFAGFDHDHIFGLYNTVKADEDYEICGIWEGYDSVKEKLGNSDIHITHESYADMLAESDADIVAIGACFDDRGKLVIEALKAGKHVICDKPICTRGDEFVEIKRLVQGSNLKLGCMLNMRYKPQIRAVRELILGGGIGDVKTVYMGLQHPLHYQFRAKWYYEKGKHGGVINDIGIHGVDMIRYISGLTPEKVLGARCWNAFAPLAPDFSDSGQFMVTLSNGAGMLADTSYSIPDDACVSFKVNFEIFGSMGAVRFSWHDVPTQVYYPDKQQPEILDPIDVGSRTYWTDFIGEINGETDLFLTTEDVLRSAEDTLLIQQYANNQ